MSAVGAKTLAYLIFFFVLTKILFAQAGNFVRQEYKILVRTNVIGLIRAVFYAKIVRHVSSFSFNFKIFFQTIVGLVAYIDLDQKMIELIAHIVSK